MEDKYTITQIDPVTGAVYLEFEYKGKTVQRFVFPDISDTKDIDRKCDVEYISFQKEVDDAPALKVEVSNLIGKQKTASEVAISMKPIEITPVVIEEP